MNARSGLEAALALAIAIAVIGTAVALGGERRETDPRATTWNSDRRGGRALFLLLEKVGVTAARHVEPPSALPAPGDDPAAQPTLAMLGPSWGVTGAEATALLDWTASGGRLVVADAVDAPPALTVDTLPLLRPLGLDVEAVPAADGNVEFAESDPFPDVRTVRWPARIVVKAAADARPDPRAGTPEFLAQVKSGPLIARTSFGRGEIVVVSDASLFSNEHLRLADDALLAVRLLSPHGGPVLFDEYHHGFTPTGTRDGLGARLAALLTGTWVGRALLAVAFAGLVLAAGRAVRLGAPLAEPAPPRRALREHADALGRLLENARASQETLSVLLAGVRRAVGPRIGLAPGATSGDLAERLGRSVAPGAAELAAAVSAAADAAERGAKDVELGRLAANLAAARRDFLRGGSDR